MPKRRFSKYNKPQTRILTFDGVEVKPYDRYSWSPGWYYEERKYASHGERIYRYVGSTKVGAQTVMSLQFLDNRSDCTEPCWVFRNFRTDVTISETIYKNQMRPPLMWAMQMFDIMGAGE